MVIICTIVQVNLHSIREAKLDTDWVSRISHPQVAFTYPRKEIYIKDVIC